MPLHEKHTEQRLQNVIAECRKRGLRLTQQRLEIFTELARSENHPDAETVCNRVRERLPHVSLDTIYRTLSSLERLGLIAKVTVLHGAARFDANPLPHHHAVCIKCGEIRDLDGPELRHAFPVEHLRKWGRVDSVHAEVRGLCAKCLAAGGRTVSRLP